MAKLRPTFNFGANVKRPAAKRSGAKAKGGKGKAGTGKAGKGNAWRAYTGGGRSSGNPF
jgi:hypothetical protein